MSDDNEFANTLNRLDADGKDRFGDRWPTLMSALRKETGGLSVTDMQNVVLNSADPAALLAEAGRESLLQQADRGDNESEAQYRAMRQSERDAYRKAKGKR